MDQILFEFLEVSLKKFRKITPEQFLPVYTKVFLVKFLNEFMA